MIGTPNNEKNKILAPPLVLVKRLSKIWDSTGILVINVPREHHFDFFRGLAMDLYVLICWL